MDAHKKWKISIKKISYIKAATGNLSKTMLNFNKAISMYLLGGVVEQA